MLTGLSIAFLAACPGPRPATTGVADREQVSAQISDFRRDWLAPARIAPPTIEFEARTATSGTLTGTATPALAEDAAWNQWAGPEARLFNNRAGLLFEIALTGEGPLRWVAEESLLRVNHEPTGLLAAPTADDLLVPLLGAALAAERNLIDVDLVDRTRAAGPFRAAYLGTAPAEGVLAGVVMFPLADAERQIVDVDLVLAVETSAGQTTLAFRWE